jgi:hypothetical protein
MLRILALLTVLAVSCAGGARSQQPPSDRADSKQQTQPKNLRSPTTPEERGTAQSPVVVKILPTPKTDAEVALQEQDREARQANDRETISFNRWLVLIGFFQLIVFVGQLVVFGYQAWKLRQTVQAAADQSNEMRNSVAESRRAAVAMEQVATSMNTVAETTVQNVRQLKETVATNREIADRQKLLGELQLRAYVNVIIGNATYQEREKNIKFGASPTLVNSGATAAKKLRYVIRAAILSIPLPDGFVFPDTTPVRSEEGMIPPHQPRTISAVVEDFYDDVEVADIKIGKGRALFTWGTVTYEDVFGATNHRVLSESDVPST